jgi:hypothetical protein
VNMQAYSDTEYIIDQFVHWTTVSIQDRGDIDISNVDIGYYEPPVIISKANESISSVRFMENPMLKSKVAYYQSIQDDSLKVNELHDVTRENLAPEFDS